MPTLVVSESDGALALGSAINFVVVDDKVRFDVALHSINRAGLKISARLLAVRGQLQREGLVTHIVAKSFHDLTPELLKLADGQDVGDGVLARADEVKKGSRPDPRDDAERRRREALDRQTWAALPEGRNFH